MRLIFLVLMFLSGVGMLSAQNTESLYDCIYKYTVTGQDKNQTSFSDEGYCMLQVGKSMGKFCDYASFQTDSATQVGCDDRTIKSYQQREQRREFFFDETVYQNCPSGKMTVHSVITPDLYTYEEDRFPVRWTMEEGRDTVCGYVCNVARGEYGGRIWIVKYAPEIPSQCGPWKLTGLPGLILDAVDSEGIHHFSAVTFRKSAVGITPMSNEGRITTSRGKFVTAKNKFEANPMGNLPAESIDNIVVLNNGGNASGSTILINGVPLRMRNHPYIPLENE